MYTMRETCEKTGLPYETLKFYCNQGLIPNVKRDSRNHRIFDDGDIAWINSLIRLRGCGMGIAEMKAYLHLCLEGESSIPERKAMLAERRRMLEEEKTQIQKSIDFIDWKLEFYEDVLSGKTEYFRNLAR